MGRRPAMPGRPCTLEAGAANDLARAHVAGYGHRLRLGVDQTDYLRLLRFFASMLGRAPLHPSVTRRAAFYESHPSWVSIQPRSRRQGRPIPAHVASFRGLNRPHGSDRELHRECRGRRCGGVHRGRADPRVELVLRRLHAWTLKDWSWGSQPGGNAPLSQNVSGCFRTCQSHRTPPPAAGRNAPVGALIRGQVSEDEIACRNLRARHGDTRFGGVRPMGGSPTTPRPRHGRASCHGSTSRGRSS